MATGHGSKSKGADMTLQEILERIQDILYQDGNVQELDLLRHDLENDIIEEDKKWQHKRRIV